MTKLQKARADYSQYVADMTAIVNTEGDLTSEQQAKFDELKIKAEAAKATVEKLNSVEKMQMEADSMKAKTELPFDKPAINAPAEPAKKDEFKVPARAMSTGVLKAFGKDYRTAYSYGQWVRACMGNESARTWCRDNGIIVSLHSEGVNTGGGYLVPIQFETALIDLRLQYGVFRRNTRVRNMTGDQLRIPRRTGGLTAYWLGESSAGTESTKGWDQVTLSAKKMGVLAKITTELSEDAIINVADDLANEIAYAFAYTEDYSAFLGNGTSITGTVYTGGITGVNVAIKALVGATTTSAGGIQVGSTSTVGSLTLADWGGVIGRCPTYARNGAKWYTSPWVFQNSMAALMYAAGGNTISNVQGGTGQQFMGYPVELSEVFPTSSATSQILALFGRLDLGTSLGDRRQTSIAFSDSAVIGSTSVFESDEIAVRGTQRLDIVTHDIGTSTVAGPIVALQALNS